MDLKTRLVAAFFVVLTGLALFYPTIISREADPSTPLPKLPEVNGYTIQYFSPKFPELVEIRGQKTGYPEEVIREIEKIFTIQEMIPSPQYPERDWILVVYPKE